MRKLIPFLEMGMPVAWYREGGRFWRTLRLLSPLFGIGRCVEYAGKETRLSSTSLLAGVGVGHSWGPRLLNHPLCSPASR